ncbi:hypothetical protein Q7526_04975 [Glaesserella parasuis]|nr:hypothetical protein [Glaesserella parasuis]MDP0341812.1 hypothetical protein [Glaesserella parasuis]MDP0357510.1 hypothetical protein [Glaesserella parasuis]
MNNLPKNIIVQLEQFKDISKKAPKTALNPPLSRDLNIIADV